MGILNVTPDSFSDGGSFYSKDRALRHALAMVEAGADVIDVGGESTRPGAHPISEQEELDRVLPVIEALREASAARISIDTMKPAVMRAALERGVWMVNDINALCSPGAIEVVKPFDCQLCLMHKQGTPLTMQQQPIYAKSVLDEVQNFFSERVKTCTDAGIESQRLWLDPGIGFGKTLAHNLLLLKHLRMFMSHEIPLMVGVSRKSLFEELTQQPVHARIPAAIAATLYVVNQGVRMIRTHDVRETKDAVLTWQSIEHS
ncbi:MAG: dihydropteroate synthase [Gammaproteobacteria bacterium]|nr:dihydropteroate synthase [Gammaproteobacteria bacterium]